MNGDRPVESQQFFGQRLAAVGVLIVQATAIGALMDAAVFSVCAIILAVVSLLTRYRRLSISLPSDWWLVIVGVLFASKYAFSPRDFPFEIGFILTELAYEVASYCVVVELLYLYRRENESKLPLSYLAFAVVGMVFTGDVRLDFTRRLTMLILVQVFLFFWALMALASRRQQDSPAGPGRFRFTLMAGVLFVSALSSTVLAIALQRFERKLESLVNQYLEMGSRGPTRTGFSGRGGLSDITKWRDRDSETVALVVYSKTAPNYLRGKAFDLFDGSHWSVTVPGETVTRSRAQPELSLPRSSDQFFWSKKDPSLSEVRALDVWPNDLDTGGHCLATLETQGVACQAISLTVDRNGIITRPDDEFLSPYTLFESIHSSDGITEHFRGADRADYLRLPEPLDPRVAETADEILAGLRSDAEKIEAVQNFLSENFQYQLGITIPGEEDRLGYFLEHRLPAHCEYFASAAAILLRLGGVPTRYVTGYLTQERNPIDSSWLARRKDAHAWVEAYDRDRARWMTVEATPAAGVPTPNTAHRGAYRQQMLSQFFRALQEYARRGQVIRVAWLIAQPLLWFLLVMIALTAIWSIARRLLNRGKKWLRREDSANELIQQRILMDNFLARSGLFRSPDEPLLQFANRIEAELLTVGNARISNWYRDYSKCRYREPTSLQEVDELRKTRMRIMSQSSPLRLRRDLENQ